MPHSRNSGRSVRSAGSDSSTLVGSESGDIYQWDGNTQDLLGIAHGSAGMIFAHTDYTVVKVYLGQDSRSLENSETERQAYRNLQRKGSSHPHVLRCYDIENPDGLVLERCRETVRQRIKSPDYSPRKDALSFATQAAEGLAYIHRCGIRQGDVGCHNMLLDEHGVLKIADFAGSSVEGSAFPSSVDYEVGSKMPGDYEPTTRTDIFALGSAIYEMITRKPPYRGVPYAELQKRFEQHNFPRDFGELPELGSIVERCWGKGGHYYDSADSLLKNLYDLDPFSRKTLYSSKAPRSTNLPTAQPTKNLALSKHSGAESQHIISRRRHHERGTYVNSNRNQKETEKFRGSRQPHKRNETIHKSTGKRHGTQVYHDGPMDHLVQKLQALLFVHSRTSPDKRRVRY